MDEEPNFATELRILAEKIDTGKIRQIGLESFNGGELEAEIEPQKSKIKAYPELGGGYFSSENIAKTMPLFDKKVQALIADKQVTTEHIQIAYLSKKRSCVITKQNSLYTVEIFLNYNVISLERYPAVKFEENYRWFI